MATVALLGTATFNTTAGNHTVVATPTLRDHIVIIAANTGRTAAQPPTVSDNNADGRGTYARHTTTATKATNVDSMWIFVRNALIGSATSTTFTAATSGDSGGGLGVFRTTAMSIVGLASIRQVAAQNNQGAGTPGPVFAAAMLTANAGIGAVFNATNPAAMTPPATGGGWGEAFDTGWATPTTGIEAAHDSAGTTASTITWGSASASAFCSIVLELDTSVPQYSWLGDSAAINRHMSDLQQGAVGRAATR